MRDPLPLFSAFFPALCFTLTACTEGNDYYNEWGDDECQDTSDDFFGDDEGGQ